MRGRSRLRAEGGGLRRARGNRQGPRRRLLAVRTTGEEQRERREGEGQSNSALTEVERGVSEHGAATRAIRVPYLETRRRSRAPSTCRYASHVGRVHIATLGGSQKIGVEGFAAASCSARYLSRVRQTPAPDDESSTACAGSYANGPPMLTGGPMMGEKVLPSSVDFAYVALVQNIGK